MSFRVRVDAAGLQDGTADKPILREHIETGIVTRHRELELCGPTRIVYRPDAPLQDGTRVWIETERVYEPR